VAGTRQAGVLGAPATRCSVAGNCAGIDLGTNSRKRGDRSSCSSRIFGLKVAVGPWRGGRHVAFSIAEHHAVGKQVCASQPAPGPHGQTQDADISGSSR